MMEETNNEKVYIEPLIQTICRDCIFKISDNSVQTGCLVNKLNLEIDELVQTDGQNYYKLKRFCNSCKNQDWAERNKVTSLADAISKNYQENVDRVKTDLIIIMGEHYNISDLDMMLASLKTNHLGKVIVSVNNQSVMLRPLRDVLNKYKIKWQAKVFLEHETVEKQIKDCFKHVNSIYYCVVTKLDEYDNEIPKKINDLINVHNEAFLAIEPVDGFDKLVMQAYMHQISGGSIEVAKKLAEEQECPNLIRKH